MIGYPRVFGRFRLSCPYGIRSGRRPWTTAVLLVLLTVLSGCVALTGDRQQVLELSQGAQPVYPQAAKDAGIEGEVTLIYTVTASGQVDDVRVLESSPAEVFDEAALAAVRSWRYRPLRRRDGEPLVLENVVSTLRFRLAEAYPDL